MVKENGMINPFCHTYYETGIIPVTVEEVQDQVSRLFSENFQRIIGIELTPGILQHSLWALLTHIFTASNFLYCHFSLTWTHVYDLDYLENGAGENCVINISYTEQ